MQRQSANLSAFYLDCLNEIRSVELREYLRWSNVFVVFIA